MASKAAIAEEAARAILMEAVRLDEQGEQLEKAMSLYTEGVGQLLKAKKETSDEAKKKRLGEKANQYLTRAEQLKTHVKAQTEAHKQHRQIRIADSSRGHSYDSLFGEFLTGNLTAVQVEDPYIRATHQINNFLRFCELLVRKAPSLKTVHLITSLEEPGRSSGQGGPETQRQRLEMVARSLHQHNVQLTIDYSSTLHDREIRLDTGWVIKIGRGLDIYKAAEGKFSIGYFDQDLRPCHETTVDIFHRKTVHDGAAATP